MRERQGLHVHVWVNNEGPGRRVNMRVNEGGRIYIHIYTGRGRVYMYVSE